MCIKSVIFALVALPLSAASVQTINPEEVGLSTERLQRVHEAIARHIDAHDISGAVTVVARKGRLAHLEAHGLLDIDSKKAMSKDSLFWIASMSKPITGVAILMLMEEGKIRLTDPVSKFVPEFRGMKVAVMQQNPGAARRQPGRASVLHGPGGARNHDSGFALACFRPGQRRRGQRSGIG